MKQNVQNSDELSVYIWKMHKI